MLEAFRIEKRNKLMIKRTMLFVLKLFIIEIVLFAFLEGSIYFLYSIFNYIPLPFLNISRELYLGYHRNLLDGCTYYDNELTYVFKKNINCHFENKEFNTAIVTNSLGVRDKEESLKSPELVILGDSFAMGWGVEEKERFSNIIKERLNINTLNTAVPSYGTVREIKMLKRIDTSNLKYIIIQYSYNDFEENNTFVTSDYNLKIMSEPAYLKSIEEFISQNNYFFGKHLICLLQTIKNKILYREAFLYGIPNHAKRDIVAEARNFIEILKHSETKLSDVKILVLELSSYGVFDNEFIRQIDMQKKDPNNPSWINNIKTVDANQLLNSNDYFILDDHLNKNGHLKLGNELSKIIQQDLHLPNFTADFDLM